MLQSNDFYLDVSRGRVFGASGIHGFGINSDISTILETVWTVGGLYVYPSSALIMSFVSSSANDASAGTGLRTVYIEGLDANRNVISEVITLAGLTPVTTTQAYFRINNIIGLTAGSNTTNVGIITISNAGTTYSAIQAGDGRSQNALYSVPITQNAYATALNFSTSQGKAAQVSTWVRPMNGIWFKAGATYMFQTATQIVLRAPVKLPKGCDLELRAVAEAATTPVAVGFDLVFFNE